MEKEVAERFAYKVLVLNGITYVPHYQDDSAYVGPGNHGGTLACSESFLKSLGATESTALLWKRPRKMGYGVPISNVLI